MNQRKTHAATERLLAAVVSLIALGGNTGARAQQGHWVRLAPFPDPCPELIGAAANGKVYVFGGLLGSAVKSLVYEYDPAVNGWIKKKSMPRPPTMSWPSGIETRFTSSAEAGY